MSTYTRKSCPGRHNLPGQRQEDVYTQVQHGGVSCPRADEEGHPFPNKPVYHRRAVSPRTQEDSLDLHDFEKITISKQPKGSFLAQEHVINGTKKTTESQHPSKDSNRVSSGELQTAEARAIHSKKLMMQEKLRRVEQITRQKIQWASVEAAAANDQMTEEDFKLIRRKQDQKSEDRMRNAHEEERPGWRRAAECPQSKRTGDQGTLKDTADKKKQSGELNKSKWKTGHTRGKGDGKDQNIKGQAHVKQQGGRERAKERQQNKTSVEKSVWPRQKEYVEKMYKDTHSSYDEQDIRHIGQEELAETLAENHRGARCRTSGEPTLPLVFGPCDSSRVQKKELGHTDSTNANIQRVICTVCNRKFNSDRLEKHVRICEKVNRSRRQAFNSYVNRTRGSAIEDFWKTHSRSKTPEMLQKKSTRQNRKANTTGRLPAGTTLQK